MTQVSIFDKMQKREYEVKVYKITPNNKTRQSIARLENNEDIESFESIEELFKKLEAFESLTLFPSGSLMGESVQSIKEEMGINKNYTRNKK